MIYLLYGENHAASRQRLNELVKAHTDFQKVYGESSSKEGLVNSFQTADLLGTKKLIVEENFISKHKLSSKHLEGVESENILILLEKKELTKTQIGGFLKIAKVEQFKLPTVLYSFLDSIAPLSSLPVKLIRQIEAGEGISLTWQILNRLLALILIKKDFNKDEVGKSLGRSLADWQWKKLKDQAAKFDVLKLKQLYFASLKVDLLIKTGKTSLNQKDLLSLMLIKHLKP